MNLNTLYYEEDNHSNRPGPAGRSCDVQEVRPGALFEDEQESSDGPPASTRCPLCSQIVNGRIEVEAVLDWNFCLLCSKLPM